MGGWGRGGGGGGMWGGGCLLSKFIKKVILKNDLMVGWIMSVSTSSLYK